MVQPTIIRLINFTIVDRSKLGAMHINKLYVATVLVDLF